MNLTDLKEAIKRKVLDVVDHRNLDLDVNYFREGIDNLNPDVGLTLLKGDFLPQLRIWLYLFGMNCTVIWGIFCLKFEFMKQRTTLYFIVGRVVVVSLDFQIVD